VALTCTIKKAPRDFLINLRSGDCFLLWGLRLTFKFRRELDNQRIFYGGQNKIILEYTFIRNSPYKIDQEERQ